MPGELRPRRLTWDRVQRLLELLVRAIGPTAALIDVITRNK
jgi:hypothetical protein